MCGINAIANFTEPLDHAGVFAARMNDAVAHRGPDGAGVFESTGKSAALGSRRLSIVDVAGGAMPITARVDGHEYAIVSNGEFFNYKALRAELEKTHRFATRSDTEVALRAYIEWGEECLAKLRGQFAFIIYDGRRKRLFLARDRVGIKPLYYEHVGAALFASSEPKGVLASSGRTHAPDSGAIAEFFASVFTLGKSEPIDGSFYAGIKALPPASYAFFNAEGLSISQYDRLRLRPSQESAADLKAAVEHAVRSQIPDEVPYGIALSGGLDSGIIAAIASQSAPAPRLAAAINYEDDLGTDLAYARLMADAAGLPLEAPLLTMAALEDDIDRVIEALDRPFDSPRELGAYEVFRTLSARGVKVAMSGEGADEFNLGYYHALPGLKEAGVLFTTGAELRDLLMPRAKEIATFFNPSFAPQAAFEEAIARLARVYEESDAEDPLGKMELFYARKLLKLRLDISDRCAMAHSLEVRVPFCDEEAVAASLSVAPQKNLERGEKAVLREAFRDLLPREITERRKAPLPEARGEAFVRRIEEQFAREMREADDSLWMLLDRSSVSSLPERVASAPWGTPQALGEPVRMGKRHLFLFLTFMRWHRMQRTAQRAR